MSQTNYTIEAALAFAGMIAEGSKTRSISRSSEDAVAFEAGRPGVAGTDAETQFVLPTGAGEVFLGVTVHKHGREQMGLAGPLSFQQNENVELLRQGQIWVIVEEAVSVGDPVFFRHTVNGGLVPGGWRTDADTANADQVDGAVFMTDA